ncbi:unnamed protein product [Amoebophrya sp. A25]|nr:unnamed protein product [Amoebophrya sp. A25]|eukprot:GSA25T00005201001.1
MHCYSGGRMFVSICCCAMRSTQLYLAAAPLCMFYSLQIRVNLSIIARKLKRQNLNCLNTSDLVPAVGRRTMMKILCYEQDIIWVHVGRAKKQYGNDAFRDQQDIDIFLAWLLSFLIVGNL